MIYHVNRVSVKQYKHSRAARVVHVRTMQVGLLRVVVAVFVKKNFHFFRPKPQVQTRIFYSGIEKKRENGATLATMSVLKTKQAGWDFLS